MQDVQLVCLGTGDPMLESGLQWMESEFSNSARGWVGFNVPFSHRLTAAADILLMPSRFEPCGLNQMYAMHYGTIPVAHATGGLRDTVITYDPHAPEGTTGWAFDGCTVDALKGGIHNALHTYRYAAPPPLRCLPLTRGHLPSCNPCSRGCAGGRYMHHSQCMRARACELRIRCRGDDVLLDCCGCLFATVYACGQRGRSGCRGQFLVRHSC